MFECFYAGHAKCDSKHEPGAELPDTIEIEIENALNVVTTILRGKGVKEEDAAYIAQLLIRADQQGKGSHGCYRVLEYCELVDRRIIDPSGPFRVLEVVDRRHRISGGDNFGQICMKNVIEYAISCLEKNPAWTILEIIGQDVGHMGTLEPYVRDLSQRTGCIVELKVWVPGVEVVAYHGSNNPTLGTNPQAIAMPCPNEISDGVLCFEYTPAACSVGQLKLAELSRKRVTPGVLSYRQNNGVCTDPSAFFTGSAMLLPRAGAIGAGNLLFTELKVRSMLGCRSSLQAKPCSNPFALTLRRLTDSNIHEYRLDIESVFQRIRAEGSAESFFPGERSYRRINSSNARISMHPRHWNALVDKSNE